MAEQSRPPLPPRSPPPSPMELDPVFVALANPLLATEWALICASRLLEAEAADEGLKQVFKRLRTDSAASAASLARLIRESGGRPTDEPGKLAEQIKTLLTFGKKVARFQRAQTDQKAALGATALKISQKTAREALEMMGQLHVQNIAWLESVLPQNDETR